jgi:hypothetical protein
MEGPEFISPLDLCPGSYLPAAGPSPHFMQGADARAKPRSDGSASGDHARAL